MARNLGFLVLLLVVTLIYQAAAVFNPISRAHRSAALELFAPVLGSSSRSLKETYEALRTFKVLGIENKPDIFGSTCQSVLGILSSASSSVKNIFYALRVNRLLKCELSKEVLTDITSRLKDSVKDANSLLDFYYPIRSLVLIKDQTSQVDVLLGDAAVYRSIKVEHLTAFSQSDGRLQYSSSNPESSTYAAGIALETLGGIVSLASSEIDDNLEIKMPDIFASTCKSVGDTVSSVSSSVKDIFYALRVDGLLKCELNEEVLMNITSRLKDSVKDANSLLDFYYPIRTLVLVKDQTSQVDVILGDAAGVFRSIKALSQSDGRWRYSSSTPESSTFAVGIALETLGGVVSLASSEIDDNQIGTLKNDILKLFDSTEKYDDGSYYFDEKLIDMSSHQDPLSATSSVVRGLTTFAEATSGSLNLPWDKILGLAKFFLAIGIPGNAKDLYYQIDALALLESNRVSIPLILSLPATVVSLTSQEKVKVRVSTVLGSAAPPLSVKLIQVFSSDSKDASTIDKELSFNSEEGVHILDSLPVDIGEYVFSFEIVLHDPEHKKIYATGDRTKVPIYVTGVVKVDNADIAVLETDIGSIETQKKHAIYTLDLTGPNAAILSANHLQKLRLSFQLTTPLGHPFEPHQAFLKLEHETGVQHIFVAGSSGKQLEFVLDFLGLVENFFYLSGTYDIELTVGDAVMENSFLHHLGYIELDLPEAPEKAPRLPPKAVDPYSRYGPKAEITHIFRLPEKRPPEDLSFAFVGLILLVFGLFIIGLMKLGANYDNFPTSTIPATCAILFVAGIFAVLDLEYVFWVLQLDLFTMLKALGILGIFLMFVGHRTLSHIASTSSKLKSP